MYSSYVYKSCGCNIFDFARSVLSYTFIFKTQKSCINSWNLVDAIFWILRVARFHTYFSNMYSSYILKFSWCNIFDFACSALSYKIILKTKIKKIARRALSYIFLKHVSNLYFEIVDATFCWWNCWCNSFFFLRVARSYKLTIWFIFGVTLVNPNSSNLHSWG